MGDRSTHRRSQGCPASIFTTPPMLARSNGNLMSVRRPSRVMVSDVGAMLSACEAGVGIAQIMQLGSRDLLAEGRMVELFPDWSGELFPLYALYPSRQLRAAKVRTFIEFAVDLLSPS